MAISLVTVTHKFLNPDATAASGVISFKLTSRITNAGVTYSCEIPVHASLDSSGNLSQVLPANNDPATVPSNTTYTVIFMLNGTNGIGQSGEEYSIVVPYNATGGTVDLGTLLPSQVGS